MRAIDLTTVDEKALAYEADRWFREGRDTFAAFIGEVDVFSLATVTLKAEVVSSRQVAAAISFLEANEFEVAAARIIRFDASNVHQLWMYHWNVATPDRRTLAQDLLSIGSALFLVLVDRSYPRLVPASVRISTLKGSAYPDRRKPDHLRSFLGAQGRMLTFVHTADEPIDVLREVGLLFNANQRRTLVRDAAARGPIDPDRIARLIASLYDRHPERSMDPDIAYEALRSLLEFAADRPGTPESEAALTALQILEIDQEQPGQLPWRRLRDHSLAAAPGMDLWNPILYATERVRHDQVGLEPVLRDGTEREWISLARPETL